MRLATFIIFSIFLHFLIIPSFAAVDISLYRKIPLDIRVKSLSWSYDSKLLAVSGSSEERDAGSVLYIMSPYSQEYSKIRKIFLPQASSFITWSKSGRYIMSANNFSIVIIEVKTMSIIKTTHRNGMNSFGSSFSFSEDENSVIYSVNGPVKGILLYSSTLDKKDKLADMNPFLLDPLQTSPFKYGSIQRTKGKNEGTFNYFSEYSEKDILHINKKKEGSIFLIRKIDGGAEIFRGSLGITNPNGFNGSGFIRGVFESPIYSFSLNSVVVQRSPDDSVVLDRHVVVRKDLDRAFQEVFPDPLRELRFGGFSGPGNGVDGRAVMDSSGFYIIVPSPFTLPTSPSSLSFPSPEFTLTPGALRFWDLSSASVVATIATPYGSGPLAVSDDGSFLALGSHEFAVAVYNIVR